MISCLKIFDHLNLQIHAWMQLSQIMCVLCVLIQPLMCPGRCEEIITGCVSPLNQAIVQLDASFRLMLCKQ